MTLHSSQKKKSDSRKQRTENRNKKKRKKRKKREKMGYHSVASLSHCSGVINELISHLNILCWSYFLQNEPIFLSSPFLLKSWEETTLGDASFIHPLELLLMRAIHPAFLT